MIQRLTLVFLLTLSCIMPTAEMNVLLHPTALTEEKADTSLCFFENSHPFIVNPASIRVIVPLIPFFKQVAEKLQHPLAINFVDVSPGEHDAFSFSVATEDMPATLFIAKESLKSQPPAMIEAGCATALAQTLNPQRMFKWGEKILTSANYTAKALFLYHLIQLGWLSIKNKSFTPTDSNGSNLLHWMLGISASWIGIKGLQEFVSTRKQKNIVQKSMVFLKKPSTDVPLTQTPA